MADEQLTNHDYDGIQEYDNPCPAWWTMLFWGTILFSVLYFLFFHTGNSGWTLDESYQHAVADNTRLRFKDLGTLAADEPTLLKYMHDPDWLKVGQSVFEVNCYSCHAKDGHGMTGPNLTDNYYKNVKKLADLPGVIQNGAANGAMPSWRNRLQQNEIVLVAAYVASLRGKELPSDRGHEGEVISPWPKFLPAAK